MMHKKILIGIGLVLTCWASGNLSAQDVLWRAAKTPSTMTMPAAAPAVAAPAVAASTTVSLGKPLPMNASVAIDSPPPLPEPMAMSCVVRGQIGGPPPPPAFPGGGPAPFTPVPGGDPYNTGVVNSDADLGGFWSRLGHGFKRCWSDVTGGVGGAFQAGPGGKMFQSDHAFDNFVSPVTNPFFFEDPRSLTEFRPVFIWQNTPSSNPIWNGGNNFVLAGTGSVAFTPHLSLVVNRIGFDWINPRNGTPDISPSSGLSEILLGPKVTFLRNETSNTVVAVGLTFDIPSGSARVLQNTGHLALIPYVSFAQAFGRSDYGTFNFMNTDGYTIRTDRIRSESFYASFHLDYDVGNLKRFYPLVEANYRHYTRNGDARDLNFEGNDLANFGSRFISGQNELTLAVGTRYKFNNNITFGIAGEFNTLSNSDGRHLDRFRLTTDVIFRY